MYISKDSYKLLWYHYSFSSILAVMWETFHPTTYIVTTKFFYWFRKLTWLGCLSGTVGWVSDFSSGHDLMVCEFEPRARLCADSSEPGAYFRFCVSFSQSPSPTLTLSLSLKNKNLKQFFKKKKRKINMVDFRVKTRIKVDKWHSNTELPLYWLLYSFLTDLLKSFEFLPSTILSVLWLYEVFFRPT